MIPMQSILYSLAAFFKISMISHYLAHCVPLPAPGPPRTKITFGLPIIKLLKQYGTETESKRSLVIKLQLCYYLTAN